MTKICVCVKIHAMPIPSYIPLLRHLDISTICLVQLSTGTIRISVCSCCLFYETRIVKCRSSVRFRSWARGDCQYVSLVVNVLEAVAGEVVRKGG